MACIIWLMLSRCSRQSGLRNKTNSLFGSSGKTRLFPLENPRFSLFSTIFSRGSFGNASRSNCKLLSLEPLSEIKTCIRQSDCISERTQSLRRGPALKLTITTGMQLELVKINPEDDRIFSARSQNPGVPHCDRSRDLGSYGKPSACVNGEIWAGIWLALALLQTMATGC